MPIGRRRALADWARSTGTTIMEDDYDSEFRYGIAPLTTWQIGLVGTPSPAIRYFDSGDSVLLRAGGVVCSG